MDSEPPASKPLVANEIIKAESHGLRGHLAADMADVSTGAISEDSGQLSKFHGLYLQDDRDLRNALKKAGQEKAFAFMLRVRLPGGRATPQQWLVLDKLADDMASPSLKLTTRQTFQFHGVLKGNVKPVIQGMHKVLLDSIAACGDVNRNVMAPPNPEHRPLLQEVYEHARAWSEYALPKTHAYHEIWLDEDMVAGGEEKETMYGDTYLPRKFKVGFALPPVNDVDIFSQGPRFHRGRGKWPASRVQRHRRRRSGHGPRSGGDVSALGGRARLHRARSGQRHRRGCAHHATRFRRPHQPPPRAAQVHH